MDVAVLLDLDSRVLNAEVLQPSLSGGQNPSVGDVHIVDDQVAGGKRFRAVGAPDVQVVHGLSLIHI